MAIDITREELRADILEITSLVVERVIDDKLTESNRSLRRMLSEDIIAVSDRVDLMDRRITKRFNTMDERFDGIDQRLDGMDQRFDGIDVRLDGIDGRLNAMRNRPISA